MSPIFKRFKHRKPDGNADGIERPASEVPQAGGMEGARVPEGSAPAPAEGEFAEVSVANAPLPNSLGLASHDGPAEGEPAAADGTAPADQAPSAATPAVDSAALASQFSAQADAVSDDMTAADVPVEESEGSADTSAMADTEREGQARDARSAAPAAKTGADLLAEAFETWHEELAEASGESPLDAGAPGVVDLSHPHPTGGASLFSGLPTRLTSLIREDRAQRTALKRMEELSKRVDELSATYGYAPVTLAIGRMVWQELPEDVREAIKFGGAYQETGELHLDFEELASVDAPRAQMEGEAARAAQAQAAYRADPAGDDIEVRQRTEPAFFRSARLEPNSEGDAYITLTTRCEVNPAVLRALKSHHVPSEDISALRTLAADPAHTDEAIARLRELGRLYLPGFSYHVSSLLGSFVHPGSVLLADLEAMKPYIESSGIMTALAGDESTRKLASQPLPPADTLDRSPETERGAGDRDVAELAAVEAVASGRSIVIDTPSGSDGPGTLAAIVADAAATGRSILYIPGRGAARRAFIDEMERVGLGELVLDFSDIDSAAHRLRTGMRLREPELDDEATLAVRAELAAARARLGDYVEALHAEDEEWGESVHSLLQHMAELMISENPPASRVRLDAQAARDVADNRAAIAGELREAATLGAFDSGEDASPWMGSALDSVEAGQEALARAARLAKETVPVIMAQSHRVASETGLTRAASLNEWLEQITMLDGIAGTLDVFVPRIYERSAQDMVVATAPKEWREEHGESMGYSDRRRLAKAARDYLKPGVDVADLHQALSTVQSLRDVWRHYCKDAPWPTIPEGMAQIKVSASEVVREIKALENDLAPGMKLEEMPMEDMLDTLRRLGEDEATMESLPRRNEVLSALEERGLGAVVADFAARGVDAQMVESELELIYASSVFEQLVGRSPALSGIGSAELARLAGDVRRLDSEHVDSLAGPVQRAVIRNMREAISRKREDTMALDSQLERYSTGMLADSIATYPRLVQASRPVWVIPAMMVAEFVPPMPWADLVIMDSMDSVAVAGAVSMLMRGRQIVVVGDTRRGGADSAVGEFAKALPVVELPTLRAHHDELATATLIEQGYEGVLEMIPAVHTADSARLIVVDGRGVPSPSSGMVEGTQVEVDTVVDAVVEHILTRPEKSLAVVCLSSFHAERLREALRQTVRGSTVLQRYLGADTREPFTIVDVTACAGLRRDCVILSVGFGKTVHGRVLHTFGPLAEHAGLTGLVDAVEAAREDLTIISSLGPGDVDVNGVSAPGPRLLAQLLDRAGGAIGQLEPSSSSEPVTPLLGDLASRLEADGWRTATNYGYEGGLRIPLVVGSDEFEGTWRLAVLVDDEEYVAEPSLRRRDRYWLERLEERGWVVFRTFSTSLFIDPVGQAQAIAALLTGIGEESAEAPVSASPSLPEGWQATLREEASQITERGKRPDIVSGLPLAAYSDDELDEIVEWICSDGRRRTEDQLVTALREELDVTRRGTQIDAVLRNVVRRSGRAADDISSALSAQSAGGTAVRGSVAEDAAASRLSGDAPDSDRSSAGESAASEIEEH